MEENKNLNEADTSAMTNDELKEAVQKTLDKVRNDGIVVGYRVACTTIMQMIAPWHKPNCSHREYERIFKKVEEFCGKALKQAEKPADETVQN